MTDMTNAPAEAGASQPARLTWREVLGSLKRRKAGVMFALGVASGLPFAALAGTLNAWLESADVAVRTIGVISLISLAYGFNFLWAPALQRSSAPFLGRIGRRRSWMAVFHGLTVVALFMMAFLDPGRSLAALTLLAAGAAFFSASFHVVVDAWRIEAADAETPIDLLSSVYQTGFRLAGLIAGLGALLLADHIGWGPTYLIVAAVAAICFVLIAFAPEPRSYESADEGLVEEHVGGGLRPEVRLAVLLPVLAGWIYAAVMLFGFMAAAVTVDPPPSARNFTRNVGPFIVLATVFAPALAGLAVMWLRSQPWASRDRARAWTKQGGGARAIAVSDTIYTAIISPMADFVWRMRWAVILVLALALSYRFTDVIWGSLAYVFYLGNPDAAAGALQHTLTDVGIASKTFGVIFTVVGIALGGLLVLRFGRMPILFVGAVLAAVTNLLFADLALSSPGSFGFLTMTGLSDAPASLGFSQGAAALGWSSIEYGAPFLDAFMGLSRLDVVFQSVDERLLRLTVAIMFENLAIGIASAAFVAYLSAIVNPRYSATQYALLASLALLLGTFGRLGLAEMAEVQGFLQVFVLTAALGAFAVVVCALEWVRMARLQRRSRLSAADSSGDLADAPSAG